MAVTAKWYGLGIRNQWNGTAVVDFDSDTIKCALVKSGYTPNQDEHDFFNDITEELTTANGYTAGGVTLTSCEVKYEGATNETLLKAANASWTATSSGITARYAIVYKSTGTSSTSPLMGYVDFGADNTAAAGSKFVIEWSNGNVLVHTEN